MNYKKIYDQIIDRGRTRIPEGYVEKHHIIPRCLGGTDNKTNLVALTPEEHFLAHVLLVKIHPESKSLISAVYQMTRGHKGKRNRRMYGWLRRRFSEYMKEQQTGEGNSQFGSKWITDGNDSVKITKDQVIPSGWSLGRKMKNHSIIEIQKPFKQKVKSEAAEQKMYLALLSTESISAALRSLEMKTAGANYAYAKKIIIKYGLTEKFTSSKINWVRNSEAE